MKNITGTIAAIINTTNVVINRGNAHGVEKGMVFGVQLPIPDIADPENPEIVLSGLFYTKGKLKVESVNENMSFCSVLPKRVYTQSRVSNVLSSIATETKEYPEINNDILIRDIDWIISKGDTIYLISEEETQK